MNSGLIGKIEKAHRYARQPERLRIHSLTATFSGDNSSYELSLANDRWTCDCHTYQTFSDCQHVMAAQQMLHAMLSDDARVSATAQYAAARQTQPVE